MPYTERQFNLIRFSAMTSAMFLLCLGLIGIADLLPIIQDRSQNETTATADAHQTDEMLLSLETWSHQLLSDPKLILQLKKSDIPNDPECLADYLSTSLTVHMIGSKYSGYQVFKTFYPHSTGSFLAFFPNVIPLNTPNSTPKTPSIEDELTTTLQLASASDALGLDTQLECQEVFPVSDPLLQHKIVQIIEKESGPITIVNYVTIYLSHRYNNLDSPNGTHVVKTYRVDLISASGVSETHYFFHTIKDTLSNDLSNDDMESNPTSYNQLDQIYKLVSHQ